MPFQQAHTDRTEAFKSLLLLVQHLARQSPRRNDALISITWVQYHVDGEETRKKPKK